MKIVIAIASLTIVISSCSQWKHACNLDSHESQRMKGYHAISANRIINQNQKNRKTNIKAAEKKRADDNRQQATLNDSRTKKHTKPSGTFKFYAY